MKEFQDTKAGGDCEYELLYSTAARGLSLP